MFTFGSSLGRNSGIEHEHIVALQIDLARQPIVSERGTAAVTDGGRLLLTPLRHTVVPPPMCVVTARATAPISALAFCNSGPCEVRHHCSHLQASPGTYILLYLA